MFPTNTHAHTHTHKHTEEIETTYFPPCCQTKDANALLAWNGGGDSWANAVCVLRWGVVVQHVPTSQGKQHTARRGGQVTHEISTTSDHHEMRMIFPKFLLKLLRDHLSSISSLLSSHPEPRPTNTKSQRRGVYPTCERPRDKRKTMKKRRPSSKLSEPSRTQVNKTRKGCCCLSTLPARLAVPPPACLLKNEKQKLKNSTQFFPSHISTTHFLPPC